MKNTATLHSPYGLNDDFKCGGYDGFLLCREGVSAAFPEVKLLESVTFETRLKASKKRGERKITVNDDVSITVGRKNFGMTKMRINGLARVVGVFGAREGFTFFVSLKK